MAIKATICKANLQIADMERHYYQDHALTLARHPSETDERMMVRLLAFALHAHEYLEFGQGMTADDEADVWQKDLTGAIELWIDVGLPDEKLIRKACGRANQVVVYCYGGGTAGVGVGEKSSPVLGPKKPPTANLPPEKPPAPAAVPRRGRLGQKTPQGKGRRQPCPPQDRHPGRREDHRGLGALEQRQGMDRVIFHQSSECETRTSRAGRADSVDSAAPLMRACECPLPGQR